MVVPAVCSDSSLLQQWLAFCCSSLLQQLLQWLTDVVEADFAAAVAVAVAIAAAVVQCFCFSLMLFQR